MINESNAIINIQQLNINNLMKIISEPFNTIGFIVLITSLYMYNVITCTECLFIASTCFLTLFIKLLFKRQRPYQATNKVRNLSGHIYNSTFARYSFPSGHTMSSTVFALIMLNKYPHEFIFNFVPVLVGFSRIFLGVHFPSDIIGGMLLGFVYYNLLK